MASLRQRCARLHLVWLWFLACVGLVIVSEVTGTGMLDGGFGSMLFGVLFLIGAPFLAIGRLGAAATAWAPIWIQAVVAAGLVLAATTLADRLVTRWLSSGSPDRKASRRATPDGGEGRA